MSKIKICGIQTLADVHCVNEAKVDYAGFVFKSGRHYVTPTKARTLCEHLIGIKSVGVLVNEPIQKVLEILQESNVDVLQLHGQEDEQYIKELKRHVDIPIWKAVHVACIQDIKDGFIAGADQYLLDSFSSDVCGGSGKKFAWEVLQGMDLSNVWIAGGIHIDNIKEILAYHPYGVDISSGAEVQGQKDKMKVVELTNEVKAYE